MADEWNEINKTPGAFLAPSFRQFEYGFYDPRDPAENGMLKYGKDDLAKLGAAGWEVICLMPDGALLMKREIIERLPVPLLRQPAEPRP